MSKTNKIVHRALQLCYQKYSIFFFIFFFGGGGFLVEKLLGLVFNSSQSTS